MVRGDVGVAVIDTVKAEFSDDFFSRVESVARYDEIQAIVLNHLEPDHTGALPELLRRSPQARVYVSARAKPILKGLLQGNDLSVSWVKTGDSLSLGGRSLSFFSTPFLHWPDTQCTWVEDGGILFSGDAFGCHVCDERLFNDIVDDVWRDFDYYFTHLMRPFRSYVHEALDLITPLPIQMLAPAHGPVLRARPDVYIERYRQLSASGEVAQGDVPILAVFYLSAYGNTRVMAEVLAAGAQSLGVRVSLHDLETEDLAALADVVETAAAVAVGSPTINGDAVSPVWHFLSSLNFIERRGKLGAAFGSYGWSGEAVPLIEDRLRGLKFRLPLSGVRARLVPTPEELVQCGNLGIDLARHLTGRIDQRIVDMADLA